MARDLFGDVTRPFNGVGARSRLTVPLSIAAHTAAVVAIVVVPLLATGALPARVKASAHDDHAGGAAGAPRPRVTRPPEAAMANPDAPRSPRRITVEPAWQRDPIATYDSADVIIGLERQMLALLHPARA
jgi:hypothetical protein